MDVLRKKGEEIWAAHKFLIVGGTVCLVIVLITVLQKRKSTAKRLALSDINCKTGDCAANTVCALVLTGGDTATTLENLFAHAACPSRIRVLIADRRGVGLYDARAKQSQFIKGDRRYTEFIRVTQGTNVFQQLKEGFKGEKYVVTLAPNCVFVQNWEQRAIDMIEAVEPNIVLVSPPVSGADQVGFPCAMNESPLQIGKAPCSPPRAIPALFWTAACSMSKADLWQRISHDNNISAQFWCAGVRFAVPPKSIIHSQFPVCALTEKATRIMHPKFADYEAYCGVAFNDDGSVKCSGRAIMGLTPDARSEEILIKFGSWGNYEEIKSQWV